MHSSRAYDYVLYLNYDNDGLVSRLKLSRAFVYASK